MKQVVIGLLLATASSAMAQGPDFNAYTRWANGLPPDRAYLEGQQQLLLLMDSSKEKACEFNVGRFVANDSLTQNQFAFAQAAAQWFVRARAKLKPGEILDMNRFMDEAVVMVNFSDVQKSWYDTCLKLAPHISMELAARVTSNTVVKKSISGDRALLKVTVIEPIFSLMHVEDIVLKKENGVWKLDFPLRDTPVVWPEDDAKKSN